MENRGIRCDLFLKINPASSRLLFHVRILTIRITRFFEGRSVGDLPWFLFCEVDLAPVHRPHPDVAKRKFSSAFTREYQRKFIRPGLHCRMTVLWLIEIVIYWQIYFANRPCVVIHCFYITVSHKSIFKYCNGNSPILKNWILMKTYCCTKLYTRNNLFHM